MERILVLQQRVAKERGHRYPWSAHMQKYHEKQQNRSKRMEQQAKKPQICVRLKKEHR